MPRNREKRNYERHPAGCDCPACEGEWLAWAEQIRALERLAQQDAETRLARPATDQEWSEFFDAEFPRAS